MSNTGYIKQQNAALGVQSPRQTEAHALVEIARRMDAVRNSDKSTRQDKIDMIMLNWRLWTIFQSELSNPDNQLPEEIKVNLLQLSNFIDVRSIAESRDPTNAGLDVIININRQVAAGLLGDGGQGLSDMQSTRLSSLQEDAVHNSKVKHQEKTPGRKSTKKPSDAVETLGQTTKTPSDSASTELPSSENELFQNLGKQTKKPRFKSKKID